MKYDINGHPEQLPDAIAAAVRLGQEHAGSTVTLTTRQLSAHLCTTRNSRIAAFLKHAYDFGRSIGRGQAPTPKKQRRYYVQHMQGPNNVRTVAEFETHEAAEAHITAMLKPEQYYLSPRPRKGWGSGAIDN